MENKWITRAMRANEAADSYWSQYHPRFGTLFLLGNRDPADTYTRLLDLGDNPSPDDVDKAIGNDSWTAIECDCCGKKNPPAVFWATNDKAICESCIDDLNKAVAEWRQGNDA